MQQSTDLLFPTPLSAYPAHEGSLAGVLWERIHIDPFNAIATTIFFLAITRLGD